MNVKFDEVLTINSKKNQIRDYIPLYQANIYYFFGNNPI